MNYQDHATAAVRNHALTMSTVGLLAPMSRQARARAEGLRDAQKRAKETGSRVRFVRSMHWAPGFFPTPPGLVARMIDEAQLEPGLTCLEPSAGTGNIVRAIYAAGLTCSCVEVVPAMADALAKEGFDVQCRDFLAMEAGHQFDRILMNPPFEKRQDEAHIRHAFNMLNPGGRLVAICTAMTAVRMADYVSQHGHSEDLPAGSFKTSERPTGVYTSIIVLNA